MRICLFWGCICRIVDFTGAGLDCCSCVLEFDREVGSLVYRLWVVRAGLGDRKAMAR
jgi:hypothetical protein